MSHEVELTFKKVERAFVRVRMENPSVAGSRKAAEITYGNGSPDQFPKDDVTYVTEWELEAVS